MPGLSTVDAQVWRAQFRRSDTRTLEQNLVGAERAGIAALIPGDKEWPSALDDLGDRRPYVLWTRGTTSFLARPLNDLRREGLTSTASMWPDSLPPTSPALSGSSGRRCVRHRRCCSSSGPRGGDTIAVVANGVDSPYPMGHRELLERVADLGLLVSEVGSAGRGADAPSLHRSDAADGRALRSDRRCRGWRSLWIDDRRPACARTRPHRRSCSRSGDQRNKCRPASAHLGRGRPRRYPCRRSSCSTSQTAPGRATTPCSTRPHRESHPTPSAMTPGAGCSTKG